LENLNLQFKFIWNVLEIFMQRWPPLNNDLEAKIRDRLTNNKNLQQDLNETA